MNNYKLFLQKALYFFKNEIDENYYLLIKGAKVNNTTRRVNLLFGEINRLQPQIEAAGTRYSALPIDKYEMFIQSFDGDEPLCDCVVFVTKKLVYYIQMDNSNEFKINSSSNILGRSQLNLLQIKRDNNNSWIVEGCQKIRLSEKIVFESFDDMSSTVLDLLDGLGDPYQNDYNSDLPRTINLSFNMKNGSIIINGHDWF